MLVAELVGVAVLVAVPNTAERGVAQEVSARTMTTHHASLSDPRRADRPFTEPFIEPEISLSTRAF